MVAMVANKKRTTDCQTEMAGDINVLLRSGCRYQKLPIMMCVVVTVYQTGVADMIRISSSS